jgi:tripartite-type tricarboxylate transporter receptor subunit TctC
VAESGLTGFEIVSSYGVVVPAKTPQPIADRLYQDLMVAVNMPDVREQLFEKDGLEKIANTPAEFATVIARKIPQYTHIVKITGPKADRVY